ncbi:hypothetical protein Tco_1526215, partial [Tanacetum coccineum]
SHVQIQEDEECPDDDSSLEAAYLAYWFIPLMVSVFMVVQDSEGSWFRDLQVALQVECSPRVVLFFPSPRFFPLGFSWEGFLRRQYRLACSTPMVLCVKPSKTATAVAIFERKRHTDVD